MSPSNPFSISRAFQVWKWLQNAVKLVWNPFVGTRDMTHKWHFTQFYDGECETPVSQTLDQSGGRVGCPIAWNFAEPWGISLSRALQGFTGLHIRTLRCLQASRPSPQNGNRVQQLERLHQVVLWRQRVLRSSCQPWKDLWSRHWRMRKRWRSRAWSGIEEPDSVPSALPVNLDYEESLHEEFAAAPHSEGLHAEDTDQGNLMKQLFGDDFHDGVFAEPSGATFEPPVLQDFKSRGVSFVEANENPRAHAGPFSHVGKAAPDAVISEAIRLTDKKPVLFPWEKGRMAKIFGDRGRLEPKLPRLHTSSNSFVKVDVEVSEGLQCSASIGVRPTRTDDAIYSALSSRSLEVPTLKSAMPSVNWQSKLGRTCSDWTCFAVNLAEWLWRRRASWMFTNVASNRWTHPCVSKAQTPSWRGSTLSRPTTPGSSARRASHGCQLKKRWCGTISRHCVLKKLQQREQHLFWRRFVSASSSSRWTVVRKLLQVWGSEVWRPNCFLLQETLEACRPFYRVWCAVPSQVDDGRKTKSVWSSFHWSPATYDLCKSSLFGFACLCEWFPGWRVHVSWTGSYGAQRFQDSYNKSDASSGGGAG